MTTICKSKPFTCQSSRSGFKTYRWLNYMALIFSLAKLPKMHSFTPAVNDIFNWWMISKCNQEVSMQSPVQSLSRVITVCPCFSNYHPKLVTIRMRQTKSVYQHLPTILKHQLDRLNKLLSKRLIQLRACLYPDFLVCRWSNEVSHGW